MSAVKKLWILAFFLLVIIGGAVGGYAWLADRALVEDARIQGHEVAELAARQIGPGIWFRQISFVYKSLQPLEGRDDIAFLYVADRDGKFLSGHAYESYLNDIKTFQRMSEDERRFGDTWMIKKEVFYKGRFQGSLLLGLDFEQAQTVLRQRLLMLAGVLAASMLILLYAFHRLARSLRRPMEMLQQQMREVENLDRSSLPRVSGELARFDRRFADELNQLMSTLEARYADSMKNHDYLERFFRLSPVPLLISDISGRLDKINAAACAFFESDAETLRTSNLERLLGTRNFHVLRDHVQKSGTDIRGLATTITGQAGAKKIVELHLTILRDANGALTSLILAFIDITDKIQTQHEILENQTRYANVNRELQTKSDKLRQLNEQQQIFADRLEQMMELGNHMIGCSDDQEVYSLLAGSGKKLFDLAGGIVFLPGKKTGTMTASCFSEDYLREMITDVDDAAHPVRKCFEEGESLVFEDEELQTLNWPEALTDILGTVVLVPIEDEAGITGVYCCLYDLKNAPRPEEQRLLAALARNAANIVDHLHGERPRTEAAELTPDYPTTIDRQREKMDSLGRLVEGIAHDFNNILGIVLPNIDLIKLGSPDNEEVQKRAGIIQEATGRAARLTRQLMSFSRNQDLQLVPLSTNELITRLVRLLEKTVGESITIETQLNLSTPNIRGDESQLNQMLMHLAMNARRAMSTGGTLTFSTDVVGELPELFSEAASDEEWVTIRVTDNGEGISPEIIDKIFDPFFTTREVGEGSGLGLTAVYGIVRSHQGHIFCENVPDGGTVFSLYFPPTVEAAQNHTDRPLAEAGAGNETILIVDGEELLRESMRDSLEAYGYQVWTANDESRALALIAEVADIDCAVVDVAMPEMAGIETTRKIREIAPHMRVLLSAGDIVTPHLPEDVVIEEVLAKPYHVHQLTRAIRQVMEK